MKTVIQRVKQASVDVEGAPFSAIEKGGLLVYFAARKNDTEASAVYMADKILSLRIFEDNGGKMNLSVIDVNKSILIIPQFTLYGDCSRGRRPGFDLSAPPVEAEKLFDYFTNCIQEKCPSAQTGKFRTHMHVHSINDGPVTFIIEHPLK